MSAYAALPRAGSMTTIGYFKTDPSESDNHLNDSEFSSTFSDLARQLKMLDLNIAKLDGASSTRVSRRGGEREEYFLDVLLIPEPSYDDGVLRVLPLFI